MKINYLISLPFVLFACGGAEKSSVSVEEPKPHRVFFIKDHSSKFKYKHLQSFPKDSVADINSDKALYEIHTPILNDLYLQVFQDAERVDSSIDDGTKVLYSIQTTNGHQGILIAGMDDAWRDNIYYRSYDHSGKFIAEAILYQKGGDGGYYTHSFGKFINDTTYIRHILECEFIEPGTDKEKCDSTTETIYIHRNGRIETVK